MTDWGYADLAFDLRAAFFHREFLSGEWAAAVYYTGGQNPSQPVWLQPQWFFPDWVSDSNFGVESSLTNHPPVGTNSSGFRVYQSVITNRDLRITMTYEMLDTTNGIAQGTSPKSAGVGGSSLTSDRYVFRQTYRITNISGSSLTDFKFFQFMHGLETAKSIYDDRNYGGAMSQFRYDNTQQGQSYGFNSISGEVVQHSDTIAFHEMVAPAAWEVGYYGRRPSDSHEEGKPTIGVHLKVEANALDGTDYFEPPEKRWVSGAQRIDMGTLSAGSSVTNVVLLTIQTSFQVVAPGVNVVIRSAVVRTNKFIINFQETLGGPFGFGLFKSTNINAPLPSWEQEPIGYIIGVPQPGWNQFQAPYDPMVPRCYYRIQAFLQN